MKEGNIMRAFNIKWDTDGDMDVLESLPKEMDIPEGMEDEEEISDYISDQAGAISGLNWIQRSSSGCMS